MATDSNKVKIKFLRDYEVKDEHRGSPLATTYTEGKTYTVDERTAMHFTQRGIAAEAR